MLQRLLTEDNQKKVEKLILFLETNNFTLDNKAFYYSTFNEKISDIKDIRVLAALLNTNLEKIKVFNCLLESLFVFFSEEREIVLTRFKWNFKTKQVNAIVFPNIANYIIKTNQKMIIKDKIKDNKKTILKWTIKVLDKKILQNEVILKIIVSILKDWKISKDLFYYLLSKSDKIKK